MVAYNIIADTIRILTAESVENAKSGHPGMPMGMAEIGVSLWLNHLRHNPKNPQWYNRDRFILSNGHGCLLQYILLHLTGYKVSINDLRNFRQLEAVTSGHPEYEVIEGVETSTGPLGQGLANGVGMALAEKLLAQEFNRPNFEIINHHTYVFLGEGCLMEGISHEVCSLAGRLQLNKLIVILDNNHISIDGVVNEWFNEDISKRFLAYHWNVIDNVDGHNILAIDEAINNAKLQQIKPTLIIAKTVIGKGAPSKQGGTSIHGAPLGEEEIGKLKQALNWNYPPFHVPEEVYALCNTCVKNGIEFENTWNKLYTLYQKEYPILAKELDRRINHILPDNWSQIINQSHEIANSYHKDIATRQSSQLAIEFFAEKLPEFFGGSADLTGSNLTKWNNAKVLSTINEFSNGNYLSYGVREFGMFAMANGMYLHGGFRVFVGTFLIFAEYGRNALRMASLMNIAPIFVLTHDSLGVGEDGPTHQPVEQLATLQLIPNMQVWRPCDTLETFIAWGEAISNTKSPSCLVLSRQPLIQMKRTEKALSNITKGGYILEQNSTNPKIVIIASGSEVALALNIFNRLAKLKQAVQVVSMPSITTFTQQDKQYQDLVLAKTAKFKIVIECGVPNLWYKYVGNDSLVIGVETFGKAGKITDVFDYFGFTDDKIWDKVGKYLAIE
jgi:transketolase